MFWKLTAGSIPTLSANPIQYLCFYVPGREHVAQFAYQNSDKITAGLKLMMDGLFSFVGYMRHNSQVIADTKMKLSELTNEERNNFIHDLKTYKNSRKNESDKSIFNTLGYSRDDKLMAVDHMIKVLEKLNDPEKNVSVKDYKQIDDFAHILSDGRLGIILSKHCSQIVQEVTNEKAMENNEQSQDAKFNLNTVIISIKETLPALSGDEQQQFIDQLESYKKERKNRSDTVSYLKFWGNSKEIKLEAVEALINFVKNFNSDNPVTVEQYEKLNPHSNALSEGKLGSIVKKFCEVKVSTDLVDKSTVSSETQNNNQSTIKKEVNKLRTDEQSSPELSESKNMKQ